MDDGEVEFPLSSSSMDSFFDELLRDSHACTHTHTCNPPGPENTHTHTCLHVHTKILPAQADDTSESSGSKSKKTPLGNREAVRKYREKKKAKAASLEDECSRLRGLNQQLVKRLQSQGALESEVSRLKCLLVDLRGRIDGEIGSFPYQKPNIPSFSHLVNPCNVQCEDEVYCLGDGFGGGNNRQEGGGGASINEQGLSGCDFDQLQCMTDQNLNGSFNSANVSATNKRKGVV